MVVVWAATGLALVLARCTGIETTNGVTVIASSSSISVDAPPYANISVFDTAYIPFIDRGTARKVTADETGNFAFSGLLPGAYTVIVAASDGREAVVFPEVEIEPGTRDLDYRAMLEPVGSLTGVVAEVPDTISNILIYFPGTGLYTQMSGAGAFSISAIPPGVYDLRIAGLMADTMVDKMVEIYRNGSVAVTVNPDSATNVGTVRFPQ
jgi:hypothetical protein